MLYIIATPIGNLSDITFRAVETLKNCDYILCEDTRHSRLLLAHYNIEKPLRSFHKFNERSGQDQVIADLLGGSNIAIISDAGTPGISDPGALLIQACIAEGIKMTAIPGPCAVIAAISLSGMNCERFQFWGFLPRKAGALKHDLCEILAYCGTTICYESPNRLLHTLECIHELAPERPLAVARELTKMFEEVQRGKAQQLLEHWRSAPLKGEIVLLIAEDSGKSDADWIHLTPREHVEQLQTAYCIGLTEAIQAVSKIRGTSKRIIYNAIHQHP